MPNKKPNEKLDAAVLWKHLEDVLVPALRLSHIDRAVYSLLLRHTVLAGQSRLRVSMNWLARAAALTATTARRSVRRLAAKGVFRLLERTRDGHLLEVLDPHQIRPALEGAPASRLPHLGSGAPLSGPAVIPRRRAGEPRSPQHPSAPSSRFAHQPAAAGSPNPALRPASTAGAPASRLLTLRARGAQAPGSPLPNPASGRSTDIEAIDFLSTPPLRDAIYARDRGLCFYCLRRLKPAARCLDHVVPQFRSGGNSYRNVVACCLECNSHKRHKPAADLLRSLYREHRLTAAEFNARLQALHALAAGKLRPTLAL